MWYTPLILPPFSLLLMEYRYKLLGYSENETELSLDVRAVLFE